MDWSSCRFRFHGWFLFGLWKQTTGGRIPLFHPNTPKTQKDQIAFLQNRVISMVGWNQPQKDVHFSKRGEHSNRIQSTPWKTSQRYCSVYLNLHKAYSWKDNSLGWSPTLDAGLNESLLHIPYSKRTRWMETGMEMKRFWQVQDLMAPMWGDMPQDATGMYFEGWKSEPYLRIWWEERWDLMPLKTINLESIHELVPPVVTTNITTIITSHWFFV